MGDRDMAMGENADGTSRAVQHMLPGTRTMPPAEYLRAMEDDDDSDEDEGMEEGNAGFQGEHAAMRHEAPGRHMPAVPSLGGMIPQHSTALSHSPPDALPPHSGSTTGAAVEQFVHSMTLGSPHAVHHQAAGNIHSEGHQPASRPMPIPAALTGMHAGQSSSAHSLSPGAHESRSAASSGPSPGMQPVTGLTGADLTTQAAHLPYVGQGRQPSSVLQLPAALVADEQAHSMSPQSTQSASLAAVYGELLESSARALRAAGAHAGELPPDDEDDARRRAKQRTVVMREREHAKQQQLAAAQAAGNLSASSRLAGSFGHVTAVALDVAQKQATGLGVGAPAPSVSGLLQHSNPTIQALGQMSQWMTGAHAGELPPDETRTRTTQRQTSRSNITNLAQSRLPTAEGLQQGQDRSTHSRQQARTSSNASRLAEAPHCVLVPSPQASLPEPAAQLGAIASLKSGPTPLSKASSLSREQAAVADGPGGESAHTGNKPMLAASMVVKPGSMASVPALTRAGPITAGAAASVMPAVTVAMASDGVGSQAAGAAAAPSKMQPANNSSVNGIITYDVHAQPASTAPALEPVMTAQASGRLPSAAGASAGQVAQQNVQGDSGNNPDAQRDRACMDDTGDHESKFNWDDNHANNSARFSVDVAEQLDALGLFAGADEDDDEDRQHDFEKVFSRRTRWYKMRYWRIYMGVQAVSLVLLVVGVVLQSQVDNVRDQTTESFRWFYFFAGCPPIWLFIDITLHYVFRWLEWFFFRESLLYLKNVQRNSVTSVFTLLLLPWYMAVFQWFWCGDGRCEVTAYSVAVSSMWRLLLCVMLFTLANLIKAVVAKLLSTHFYRSAHFQKLNAALEKEVFLQALSRPKRKVVQQREQRELQSEATGLRHSSKISSFGKLFSLHTPASTSGIAEGGPSGKLESQSTRSTQGWGASSLAREPASSIHYHNCQGTPGQDGLDTATESLSAGEQVRLANSRPMMSFTAGVTNRDNAAKTPELARRSWGSGEAGHRNGPSELARRSLTDLRRTSTNSHGAHEAPRLSAGSVRLSAGSAKALSLHAGDPHKQVEATLAEASKRIMGASLAHHTLPQDVHIVHTWAPQVMSAHGLTGVGSDHSMRLQGDAATAELYAQQAAANSTSNASGQIVHQQGGQNTTGMNFSTLYALQGYSGGSPAMTYFAGHVDRNSSPFGSAAMTPASSSSPFMQVNPYAHVPRGASPPPSMRSASPASGRRTAPSSSGGTNRVAPLPPRLTKSSGGRTPRLHETESQQEATDRASAPVPTHSQSVSILQPLQGGCSTVSTGTEQAAAQPVSAQAVGYTPAARVRYTGVGSGSVPPAPPATAPLPPPPVPLPWPLSSRHTPREQAALLPASEPAAASMQQTTVADHADAQQGNAQHAGTVRQGSTPDEHTITVLHGTPADLASANVPLSSEQSASSTGAQPTARRARFEAEHQLPPIAEGPASRGGSITTTSVGPANNSFSPYRRSISIRAMSKGGETVLLREGRSKAGGPTSVASDRARRVPSFTQALGPMAADIIQAVPTQNANRKDLAEMSEAELEKVRTAVVIKTYAAIVRNYSRLSPEDMERELTAIKAFSRALFHNIRGEAPRLYLTLDDFCTFFDNPDHAAHAFAVFDVDGDGHVTRKEVREAIEAIFRERANMADSLRDTDAIVQSLEWAVGAIVHFLFLAFYLLIFGVDIVQGFSTFSATLLAFTFIFGNAVKNMFEALLFLFVTHPFDVGDNINISGEVYRIKKITLLITEMVCINGERIFFPNTDLITKSIINLTRSSTKTEFITVQVDVGVPPDVLADIMSAMVELCQASPTEYDGLPFIQYRDLGAPMKVVLLVSWTYAFPPDNWKRLVPARNAMFGILQAKLFEHRLRHTVQETELKTVRQLPAYTRSTGMPMS